MNSADGQIILCFECGTQNRLQPGWAGMPVCGKCGNRLPVDARPTSPTFDPSKPTRSPSPVPSSPAPRRSFAPVWIILVIAVLGAWLISQNNRSSTSTGRPTAPAQTTAAPAASIPSYPPVPVSPGVLYNTTGKSPLAPLTIQTARGADYYIKLVDIRSSRKAVGIFVRGGTAREFIVPLGVYEMRYAAGQIWYGTKHVFGPDTRYAKADLTFTFSQGAQGYNGYTVELILQAGGNLPTSTIAPSQF